MMQGSSGPPRRRWRIAWLLGLGVLVNYFDRVNLSVSHDALITAFGISTVTFGYLSGAYNWTYAAVPAAGRRPARPVRRSPRRSVSTFLWSVASFAAAVTPSIRGFFAARFLLGVGEAPTFPANAKAIGLMVPSKRAELRHRDLRFRREVLLSHRRAADRHPVAQGGLAMELCRHRPDQPPLLPLFSKVYRDPNDDPKLTEVGAKVHHGRV